MAEVYAVVMSSTAFCKSAERVAQAVSMSLAIFSLMRVSRAAMLSFRPSIAPSMVAMVATTSLYCSKVAKVAVAQSSVAFNSVSTYSWRVAILPSNSASFALRVSSTALIASNSPFTVALNASNSARIFAFSVLMVSVSSLFTVSILVLVSASFTSNCAASASSASICALISPSAALSSAMVALISSKRAAVVFLNASNSARMFAFSVEIVESTSVFTSSILVLVVVIWVCKFSASFSRVVM